MARPMKDGVDYFPMDIGFMQDKKVKLIKGEFGAKGIVVLLQLLCSIYGGSGYFEQWDEDDCLLMSEGVDGDMSTQLIQEVVQGCVRRSIFDSRVYSMFGVLTSKGIQRRYLRAVSTRDYIEIFSEYWLLDINDKKDVPAGISKKITFKNVSLQINPDKTQINSVDLQIYPQSKVKNSREENSREEERKEDVADASTGGGPNVFQVFEGCGFQITSHNVDELNCLSEKYSSEWVIEAIKRSSDRGKKYISYIKGILSNWEIAGSMDDTKKADQEKGSTEAQKQISAEKRKQSLLEAEELLEKERQEMLERAPEVPQNLNYNFFKKV